MTAPPRRATFVSDAILVDEIGLESGIYGDWRLRSSYQPIFSLRDGKVAPVAVEGLIAPYLAGRPVSPAHFFPRVPREDRLFVESMCRALHLRNHHNIGVPGLELFFNYDPVANADLDKALGEIAFMVRRLGEIGLDPRLLVCEITEAAAPDAQVLAALAAEMRAHGLRIALDDYGAGASTAERLVALKPDIVKIDGPWFRTFCADAATGRLLRPIVSGLQAAGAKVLVEGVETALGLEVALAAGIDLAQGDLLGRPALVGTVFDERARDVEDVLSSPAPAIAAPDRSAPLIDPPQQITGRAGGRGR